MPLADSITLAGTLCNPATTLRTSGNSAYNTRATIAGAMPIPLTPCSASQGSAFANPANGAISKPNSAIDGTVWIMFRVENIGVCKRTERKHSTPSGMPITNAGTSVASKMVKCCNSAASNTSCRL
ncbi:hypothetical protein D3C80_1674150 [compost metagenome]